MSTPYLNLIVIRAVDPNRSVAFYQLVGLNFTKHRHGTGPEHFASEEGPIVFEIYPRGDGTGTAATRLGFKIASLDETMAVLQAAGVPVHTSPAPTEWGYRAVVLDPDGHRVELVGAA
jgi:catechol 2,3-dioxygenase-like lactoylglutathione lyase family enzyme